VNNANFNFGRPLIPLNSRQSVDLAVVNKGASAEAEDPTTQPVQGPLTTPVVWLLARSTQRADSFFAYDGFVFPATNLSVTATGSPKPGTVGGVLTYRVTVANSGPAPSAPDVVLEATVSAPGLEFVSATSSKGSCGGDEATDASTVKVSCQLGELAHGEKVTATIATRAGQAGSVAGSFTVKGLRPDQSIQNNTARVQITVK
jgi:uncharacterized repeat protein (TIGR01451 family)